MAIRTGIAVVLGLLVSFHGIRPTHAELFGGPPSLSTQGNCSSAVYAEGNAYVSSVCGMSPEQVGRAIAAALKHPPLVENSDSADCSPKVYARGTAVVKTVCGMTPEQVGRTVAEATSELHAALEQVREAAGLTEGAARGLLSELGHKDLTADQLPGYLANAVAEYHQIVDRLNTLEGQDPKLERLRLEALSAVESGNLVMRKNFWHRSANITTIVALRSKLLELNYRLERQGRSPTRPLFYQ